MQVSNTPYVWFADMGRMSINRSMLRDRLDVQPVEGADDSTGNFAAIGNQDSIEHNDSYIKTVRSID
jgi:hypothetical protein